MYKLNSDPFAGDKVANSFGLHTDGKARLILSALYDGNSGPFNDMISASASLSPSNIAKSNGLSVNLVYGLMRPYAPSIHKAIVRTMQEYNLGFRQAAKAAGYDPVKALGSVALDPPAFRAVTGIIRGKYAQGVNDAAYVEAVKSYLSEQDIIALGLGRLVDKHVLM